MTDKLDAMPEDQLWVLAGMLLNERGRAARGAVAWAVPQNQLAPLPADRAFSADTSGVPRRSRCRVPATGGCMRWHRGASGTEPP